MAFFVNSNFVVLVVKKFIGLGRLMAKRRNYKDLKKAKPNVCMFVTSAPCPPYLIQPQTRIKCFSGGLRSA